MEREMADGTEKPQARSDLFQPVRLETALSASARFGVPCWAAGNAGLLAAWQPPPEAKRIVIFGDNDPDYGGQAAAYALARRIGLDGRIVEVQIPVEVDTDWNDEHQLHRADTSPDTPSKAGASRG